jgi:hypothetical protein
MFNLIFLLLNWYFLYDNIMVTHNYGYAAICFFGALSCLLSMKIQEFKSK